MGVATLGYAQLLAALVALAAAGTALERTARLGSRSFLFHRIALGQAALLGWFALRSLSVRSLHLPGVTSIELWLLALGALALPQKTAPARVPARSRLGLVGFWLVSALLCALCIHARFTSLTPPSTDLEFQSILARLFADHGAIVFTQAPDSPAPIWYPSAFPALAALLSLLSRLEPVQLVSIVPALQATLALGLSAELLFVWRGERAALLATLLTLVGQLVFALSINADHPTLHSPARLSHSALLLLPLTLGLRLAPGARSRADALFWMVVGFAAAFAVSLNPAHALVALPWLVAALLAASWSGGLPLWPPGRAALFALAPALVVLASDAWVHGVFFAAATNGAALQVAQAAGAPLRIWTALGAGLRLALSANGRALVPPGCLLGGACALALDPLRVWLPAALGLSALFAIVRARRAPAASVSQPSFASIALLLLALLWSLLFLAGAAGQVVPGASAIGPVLFQRYAREGLLASMPWAFLLLCALALAWLAQSLDRAALRLRMRATSEQLATAAALVGLGALALALPGWSESVGENLAAIEAPEGSSLGHIAPEDVAFAKVAAARLPPGARVLLPGLTLQMNRWETWHFAMSGARALALYTRAPFAFHLDLGGPAFTAEAYQRRVCRSLDLPWLLDQGVGYLLLTPEARRRSCMHQPELAARWFEPLASDPDGRVLLRIRAEERARLERDPVLDIPLAAPLPRAAGELESEVWSAGPESVRGFVCARGVETPVTLSVDLSPMRAGAGALRELHAAGTPLDALRTRCAGPGHAFAFAPSLAPPGRYRARLAALAPDGSVERVLADSFILDVPP